MHHPSSFITITYSSSFIMHHPSSSIIIHHHSFIIYHHSSSSIIHHTYARTYVIHHDSSSPSSIIHHHASSIIIPHHLSCIIHHFHHHSPNIIHHCSSSFIMHDPSLSIRRLVAPCKRGPADFREVQNSTIRTYVRTTSTEARTWGESQRLVGEVCQGGVGFKHRQERKRPPQSTLQTLPSDLSARGKDCCWTESWAGSRAARIPEFLYAPASAQEKKGGREKDHVSWTRLRVVPMDGRYHQQSEITAFRMDANGTGEDHQARHWDILWSAWCPLQTSRSGSWVPAPVAARMGDHTASCYYCV